MQTQNQTKHTPGPWGCLDTSNHAHDYRLTKPDGRPLPLTVEANDHSEQRANARLIAAAPELLAALEVVLAFSGKDMPSGWGHIAGFCEKAIAKAKGGEA